MSADIAVTSCISCTCPHTYVNNSAKLLVLQIATCDDVMSRSCEVIADGVGSVQNLTQLSDTIYEVVVQV